jgi:negative regulator of flagellin synthesis FlgM
MKIRSSPGGLKSNLETAESAPATTALLKSGSTTGGTEVRMDKVAAIQAALAAGTYNVSALDVASKVVDSMLDGQS